MNETIDITDTLRIIDFENATKLLRAAVMVENEALGDNPADTARQYHYLTAAATMRALTELLTRLAAAANAEANRLGAEATEAEAERKELKRKGGAE